MDQPGLFPESELRTCQEEGCGATVADALDPNDWLEREVHVLGWGEPKFSDGLHPPTWWLIEHRNADKAAALRVGYLERFERATRCADHAEANIDDGYEIDLDYRVDTIPPMSELRRIGGSPTYAQDHLLIEQAIDGRYHQEYTAVGRLVAWRERAGLYTTDHSFPGWTDECHPAVLFRIVTGTCLGRCPGGRGHEGCQGPRFLPICVGCGWVGEPRDEEDDPEADGHDHAYPGWRDLALLNPRITQGVTGPWLDDVVPDGYWDGLNNHFRTPIRTVRSGIGTRHVPSYAPGGGYDMCGIALEVTDDDDAEALAEEISRLEQWLDGAGDKVRVGSGPANHNQRAWLVEQGWTKGHAGWWYAP